MRFFETIASSVRGWASNQNQKGDVMSNYTDKEAKVIASASPLTFEKAQEIADQLGKTQRSVIAKAKSMGLAYIPKAKPAKRPAGETKADLVNRIAVALGSDSAELVGLEKATTASLNAILARVI